MKARQWIWPSRSTHCSHRAEYLIGLFLQDHSVAAEVDLTVLGAEDDLWPEELPSGEREYHETLTPVEGVVFGVAGELRPQRISKSATIDAPTSAVVVSKRGNAETMQMASNDIPAAVDSILKARIHPSFEPVFDH